MGYQFMQVWRDVGQFERKQFEAISLIFSGRADLLSWLFDPKKPRLRFPADEILVRARGFSSGEQLLIKFAVDLWCEQGDFRSHELQSLDTNSVLRVLKAVEYLYA